MEFFAEYKSIFIVFHALAAAVGLGATTVTDAVFFDFLRDFSVSKKEVSVMAIFSRLLWIALGILIITGIALFLSDPAHYSVSSKFITKMVIVGIITLNGILLNMFLHPRLLRMTFERMHPDRIITHVAFASGVISMISWYTVFILGSIRSIPISTSSALGIYAGLITIGVLVSQYICYRMTRSREMISKNKNNFENSV